MPVHTQPTSRRSFRMVPASDTTSGGVDARRTTTPMTGEAAASATGSALSGCSASGA
jgi:hypothetical protein